jgi:hypothetical protein
MNGSFHPTSHSQTEAKLSFSLAIINKQRKTRTKRKQRTKYLIAEIEQISQKLNKYILKVI